VSLPETAGKVTVLPSTVKMIAGVVSTTLMSHPLVVLVNVRSFRMT
jgi:hypothetical protein